ncbi:hypothetical protein CRQ24_23180, partial [Salmonella enterica subsp. enterica serovar Derby]|nr:hypothetical protein [Salmonella enterica subsp. enterica serovar Derby]
MNRKLTRFPLSALSLAFIMAMSGCSLIEIDKMQKQAQADAGQARQKIKSLQTEPPKPLTWTETQWINTTPIPAVTREKKQQAPNCTITQARRGSITIQELGQRITTVCGIPVVITPDAINTASMEGGTTRQLPGSLPIPDESGRIPLS